MLCDEIFIELLDTGNCFIKNITYACQFEMFCCGEKGIFVNFNTDSKISLCSRALFLRYVVGQNRGYHISLSDFKQEKNNNNLLYFRSVSFIASRSLFFITQYYSSP